MLVSNRGPLSFRIEDGELRAKRGAGGLVSGLGPLVAGTDALWIAAAMSDADRQAAAAGVVDAEGFRTRLLDIDESIYRPAYDVVCNATLWFVHHGLYELSRRPRLDGRWREAWDAYRTMNQLFADAIASDAPEGASVLIQDYHLCLVAQALAGRRDDLQTSHFSHTPFAPPELLRVLPTDIRRELLEAMSAHQACGFHARRWATAFERSCQAELGKAPPVFVSTLSSDPDDLGAVADSDECATALAGLDRAIGDRRFLLRVDRIELSKNLLRGFWAFDDLLERYPRWRGNVTFGAFVYPSREGLPEYLAYRQEVETAVERLNERWGTDEWTPVLFDPSDHFPRSVAALRRFDVLLVNPISDGLNLVAKEGALLNQRDGVVVLSTEAGAFAELEDAVLPVDPFDITGTADVLDRALDLPAGERHTLATGARKRVAARTPADWLADQLAAIDAD